MFGANRTCVDAASQKAASLAQGAAKQDALLRSAGLSPAASPPTSQLQSEFLGPCPAGRKPGDFVQHGVSALWPQRPLHVRHHLPSAHRGKLKGMGRSPSRVSPERACSAEGLAHCAGDDPSAPVAHFFRDLV